MRPTIHIGRGSVAVENPPQALLENLRRFRRGNDGGSYEPLYIKAEEGNMIVTAPGFARRIIDMSRDSLIKDERIPMPDPIGSRDYGFWDSVISDAVMGGGGVVAIPEILGAEEVCASIIRAFPHEALVDRGTPLCVIAEKDLESARRTVKLLRAMLPDRDVCCPSLGGLGNDGDDVIITIYNSLDDIPLRMAGIFIGLDLHGSDFIKRAEKISMLRNAARWGIYETSFGGRPDELDMDVEAMFGPVISSVTYDDAVKAGIAAPITVCWLPCPRPKAYIGGNPKVLAAFAMQENEKFVEMVSNIILNTSGELGCICRVETLAAAGRIGFRTQVTQITRKVPIKNRQRDIGAIETGVLRKAIIAEDVFPKKTSHAVMAVVTCGGAEAARSHIPWIQLKNKRDRAYIIDFTHDWDLHNGRKGHLALNDEARKKCYKDMGFNQISLEHFSQLPFL